MRHYINFLKKFFGSYDLDLYYIKYSDCTLFARDLMQDLIH